MSLTQINATDPGAGLLTNVLGIYVSTGNVTATGDGTNSLAIALGNLTLVQSDVTFSALTAAAGSSINLLAGTHLTIGGLVGVGALNNYVIQGGSTLTLQSAVELGIGQNVVFTDGTGQLELGSASLVAAVLGQVQNFQNGDRLTFDGANYTPTGSSYDAATGILTLAGINGTPNAAIVVSLSGSAVQPEYFDFSSVGGNETITLSSTNVNGIPACYLRGTRIATDRGEVAVEDLQIGDLVVTTAGDQPIRWIGTRSYSGRFLAGRPEMQPVLFKQGSLGGDLPVRDLWVSPKHAMYLRDVLVPAESLVNGDTIVGQQSFAEIDYFHIELADHAVLYAEGAPSESYVEDHNRGMFQNSASFSALYPDAAARESAYFARRLEDGYEVEEIRLALMRCPSPVASDVQAAA